MNSNKFNDVEVKEESTMIVANKFIYKSQSSSCEISASVIDEYRNMLIKEMLKMGANEVELELVHDTIIKNSILNNRSPEDVAWAILQ